MLQRLTGDYGAPVLRNSKVPRTWQLQACYVKMADGKMLPRSPEQVMKERMRDQPTNRNTKRPSTAPSKRGFGAPRPPRSATCPRKPSFLVTQLEMEDSLLRIDDEVFDRSSHDCNSSMNNSLLHASFEQRPFSAMNGVNTPSRPPSGQQVLRPKSNTLGLRKSRISNR